MNIGEYINERLSDVRYYLRGINYNDLNKERAVEGLREDVSDFFNKAALNEDGTTTTLYKDATKELVQDIKGMYENLEGNDLFLVNTKAEVDNAILKFERNLKQRVIEFKNRILLLFVQSIDINNMPEDFKGELINTSVDDVKIKVRSREDKKTMEETHDMKELFGLREIFVIIYTFKTYIEDKSKKLNEINDKIFSLYENGSQEQKRILNAYNRLLNENNYEYFVGSYELVDDELSERPRRIRN